MSEPANAVRRRLLKDLLSYAAGSYLGVVSQPLGFLLKGIPQASPSVDLAMQKSLEVLRSGLAEKMGISPYRVDESNAGELVTALKSTIGAEEASLSIPRDELAGLVAAYAGAMIHKEKGLYITNLGFSKTVKGSTFDVVGHVSFGMLCVRLEFGPIPENAVSDLASFCVAPSVEEAWLVAPGLEDKVIWGSPKSLWENKYLVPFVRLTSYERVFGELMSPVKDSFKSRIEVLDNTVILHLSQQTRARQGSIGGLSSEDRAFSAK